ncbi:MAG: TolC family protein [Bryobacteraceae bacterium]|nr:TolC family protein [Bryobacteraceae bacterium]
MRLSTQLVTSIAMLACLATAQPTPQRLTLAEAEQIAVRNNPRIGAALSTADATAQVPAQLRSAYSPALSGNVTGAGAPSDTRIAAGGLNNPVIYSRFASGFSASQLLTDFGRTSSLARSAELRANSEFETHKATRAEVLLAVHRAFLAGLRADAMVSMAEQAIASRRPLVDYARAMAESKLKSELDVRFAEVSLAEAQLLLENARNERSAADAELSMVLGYASERRFELVAEPPRELPSTLAERLVAKALSSRPEVAGRRYDLEAANKLVEAERKLRWPSIAGVASFGVIPAYNERLGNNHYAAIGLNVGLPILNGGLFKARQAEAQHRAVAARRRVDELTQRISRDVAVALINAQSASQRMALTTRLVEQASLAMELAQSRYDLGLSSIVELSQAQFARTNAEIQKINATFDYQLQRSLLGYHIGELQ